MVDPHLLHAALEAGQIAEVPIFVRLLARFGWQSAQEQRRREFEIVLAALVDDGTGQSSVHAQREVLFDCQQLDHVVLAVGDHFEAVHRRDRVVAHIIADPNAPVEQFDGQMLDGAVVQ